MWNCALASHRIVRPVTKRRAGVARKRFAALTIFALGEGAIGSTV
jgi:hypothetical protein